MSMLSNFTALDELVQVIYQDINKYVVVSSVSDAEWTVHLGQSDEGRWWVGRWNEDSVNKIIGSNVSDMLLETVAEKLSGYIIAGELYVKNIDSDASLVLGPASKSPMSVSLTEMDANKTAIYLTRTMIDIALNAQKRKCQLNPSNISVAPDLLSPPSSFKPLAGSSKVTRANKAAATSGSKTSTSDRPKIAARTSSLREETERLEERKRKEAPTMPVKEVAATSKPSRAPKGASLANPNKKARKYQALEFGSDEE